MTSHLRLMMMSEDFLKCKNYDVVEGNLNETIQV